MLHAVLGALDKGEGKAAETSMHGPYNQAEGEVEEPDIEGK